MLKSAGGQTEKAENKKEADLDEMYSHVRDNLKSIDSQEISITGILNEEYDDWGIAMFLLYLYEGQWNGKGIAEMI